MTVREWLEIIEDREVREKALSNMWHEYQDDKRICMYDALKTAFNWIKSPEGFQYWKDKALFLEAHYITVYVLTADLVGSSYRKCYRKYVPDVDLYHCNAKDIILLGMQCIPDDVFNVAKQIWFTRPLEGTEGGASETIIGINM